MPRVAILIPCYNEEKTVSSVISNFHSIIPEADIYVYDNNSTDNTAMIAKSFDYCHVGFCKTQGKGATVRKMFEEIDADIYLMADGDSTYPEEFAPKLISSIAYNDYDMTLGDRLSSNYYESNKRPFHGFGNWLVKFLVNFLYHGHVTDIMTGYRAFSRRFVKSVVIDSDGFEVETEMTIFALENGFKIGSIPIEYRDRPSDSYSKLNTFSDGMKVIKTILRHKFCHKKP
jgi:glycosyltransferase involved in cell wall biosynthesis